MYILNDKDSNCYQSIVGFGDIDVNDTYNYMSFEVKEIESIGYNGTYCIYDGYTHWHFYGSEPLHEIIKNIFSGGV